MIIVICNFKEYSQKSLATLICFLNQKVIEIVLVFGKFDQFTKYTMYMYIKINGFLNKIT